MGGRRSGRGDGLASGGHFRVVLRWDLKGGVPLVALFTECYCDIHVSGTVVMSDSLCV